MLNGKKIEIELSVDWLTAENLPYIKFYMYCAENGYVKSSYTETTFFVDFVWLIPSENMYKNVDVWKMLDRHSIDWDDRCHIPLGPWEYDEYIECYEASLAQKKNALEQVTTNEEQQRFENKTIDGELVSTLLQEPRIKAYLSNFENPKHIIEFDKFDKRDVKECYGKNVHLIMHDLYNGVISKENIKYGEVDLSNYKYISETIKKSPSRIEKVTEEGRTFCWYIRKIEYKTYEVNIQFEGLYLTQDKDVEKLCFSMMLHLYPILYIGTSSNPKRKELEFELYDTELDMFYVIKKKDGIKLYEFLLSYILRNDQEFANRYYHNVVACNLYENNQESLAATCQYFINKPERWDYIDAQDFVKFDALIPDGTTIVNVKRYSDTDIFGLFCINYIDTAPVVPNIGAVLLGIYRDNVLVDVVKPFYKEYTVSISNLYDNLRNTKYYPEEHPKNIEMWKFPKFSYDGDILW